MRYCMVLLMACLWLLLAACSPNDASSTAPEPLPRTASETPMEAPLAELPEGLEDTLRAALVEESHFSPDEITLQRYESVQWNNACLGVLQPGEFCAEVITPGYRVVFNTPRGVYVFHSDRTGQSFRLAESP